MQLLHVLALTNHGSLLDGNWLCSEWSFQETQVEAARFIITQLWSYAASLLLHSVGQKQITGPIQIKGRWLRLRVHMSMSTRKHGSLESIFGDYPPSSLLSVSHIWLLKRDFFKNTFTCKLFEIWIFKLSSWKWYIF